MSNYLFDLPTELIEIIYEKIEAAVAQTGITEIAIGGGVAANSGLRNKLKAVAEKNNWTLHLPPFAYTTDNAAMIGIVGYFKYNEQRFGALDQSATARLPI